MDNGCVGARGEGVHFNIKLYFDLTIQPEKVSKFDTVLKLYSDALNGVSRCKYV